jgi:hypothetical protein
MAFTLVPSLDRTKLPVALAQLDRNLPVLRGQRDAMIWIFAATLAIILLAGVVSHTTTVPIHAFLVLAEAVVVLKLVSPNAAGSGHPSPNQTQLRGRLLP